MNTWPCTGPDADASGIFLSGRGTPWSRRNNLTTASKKLPRIFALFITLLLLAALLPLAKAGAVSASVQMQHGFDLQGALSKATNNGTSPAYEDIDRLYISGNGTLTAEDGNLLKTLLPNLSVLDLAGYEGGFEAEAFAENTRLRRVVLPEDVRFSRKMFFACTSLEDIAWPARYTLANDCLSYCALDFSTGYPALLSDSTVDTYAAHQRPLAYLSLPGGDAGTLRAGEPFTDPVAVLTCLGSNYTGLANEAAEWLATTPADLVLTRTILRGGQRITELDTNNPGIYTIIYSLPSTTPAGAQSITYTLTVMTADGGMPLELTGLPGEVRVGEPFELGCASPGAENADCWEWDTAYFDAAFESPASFVPLKAGATTISFTGPNGEVGEVQVNILPAKSSDGQKSPGTRWALPVSLFVLVIVVAVAAILLVRRRQAARKDEDSF